MAWDALDGLVRHQSVVSMTVLVLACWRLTSFMVQEDGPFGMFAKFRHLIGVRYIEGSSTPYGTNVISRLLSCTWCCTMWIGIALTVAYVVEPVLTVLASLPFALSTGAIIVERIIDG